MANERTKVVEVVVLIALAIIAQVIAGTLGQVSTVAGGSIPIASSSMAVTNSVNAINMGSVVNSLQAGVGLFLTLSGSSGSISSAFPITLSITGNTVSTYATNTASAIPGSATTLTYVIRNATSPQTLSTNGIMLYNVITIGATGANPYESPSVTFAVSETFNGVRLATGFNAIANTITGTGVLTVTNSTASTNFASAGTSVTTVLNFMSIIFLIAAVVILLSLFGLDKIFQVGGRE